MEFKHVLALWIMGVIVQVALAFGLIWVAVHFISKYW